MIMFGSYENNTSITVERARAMPFFVSSLLYIYIIWQEYIWLSCTGCGSGGWTRGGAVVNHVLG